MISVIGPVGLCLRQSDHLTDSHNKRIDINNERKFKALVGLLAKKSLMNENSGLKEVSECVYISVSAGAFIGNLDALFTSTILYDATFNVFIFFVMGSIYW